MTCAVVACSRPVAARGWCIMHYKRWWKSGSSDVGPASTIIARRGTCSVDECESPHQAHGYCERHYRRWRSTGNPGPARLLQRDERPQWRGDAAGYQAAHHRIWDERGKARLYSCAHCGERAAEWAFNHETRVRKVDECGRPYSLDANDYMPLCRSCHRRYDRSGVAA